MTFTLDDPYVNISSGQIIVHSFTLLSLSNIYQKASSKSNNILVVIIMFKFIEKSI